MARLFSAREANQHFSEILGRATDGETVIITRRGKPVAKLVRYTPEAEAIGNLSAWQRLSAKLEAGLSLGGEVFDRDSLYER